MKLIVALLILVGFSLWVLKKRYNFSKRWIYLISFLALLMIPCYIVWKRINIYPYDVNMNYEYNLIEEKTDKSIEIKELNLNKHLDTISGYESGFIEININSTLLGNIFQPRIEINSMSTSENQYFEYGVKGRRFINISNSIKNKDLSLNFRYCKQNKGAIKIHLFNARDLCNEKILILSPHPDDAEIAAFGLYSANPRNTVVVTINAGDNNNLFSQDIANSKELTSSGKIRVWNSITIPLLAGLEQKNIINLGYFDGTLKLLYDKRDTSNIKSPYNNQDDIFIFRDINFPNTSLLRNKGVINSSWRSLVQDISYIIEQVKPTIILTPHPLLDRHPDHVSTTMALFEALENNSCNDLQIWMYTNHFKNQHFIFENYPEGLMESIISLPPLQNDSVFLFDKIFSHPLSNEIQVNKAIALEAHNALRLPYTDNFNNKSLIRSTYTTIIRSIYNNNISYFRRSVRSNELFFVVYPQNIRLMQEFITWNYDSQSY